jgi:hypothetical protein
MSITKEQIKETLKTVMAEEANYKAFFKKALEKAGKSIPSMSDEEKKKFFNKIDAAWDGKGEKNEGNAFGAAVTKAKKDGDDEFEVDGKTYKVEESHSDCGCGCGGCSTSANVVSEFKNTLSKELQFEVTTFLDKPNMDNKLDNVLEIKDVINIILNEGIENVLTEKVQSEFTKIVKQTK